MTDPGDHRIELRGESITYAVRRSDRATRTRIDVDLDGVTVVLPRGAHVDPTTVLESHADWVVERHRAVAARRDALPERRFAAGATFPYRGTPHEIVVETRSRSVVDDDALRLAAHHVEQTSVKRALEALYRRVARDRFESLAAEYAAAMNVEYAGIQVRNQRTKWGSCSSRGTLSLNWRLVMAPPEILEYVVVHEVAHLRKPNHGDAFWSLVEAHDPDYEAHAAWLDEHGERLLFEGPGR